MRTKSYKELRWILRGLSGLLIIFFLFMFIGETFFGENTGGDSFSDKTNLGYQLIPQHDKHSSSIGFRLASARSSGTAKPTLSNPKYFLTSSSLLIPILT